MTSVLIADDHPLVAEGIERVLTKTDEFEVVGHCHCGADALETADEVQPDIIVLDLRLGDLDGAEVCRRLAKVAPLTRVVVLTAFDDLDSIRRCLDSGAAGVLLKGALSLDLVQALRDIGEGRVVIDSSLGQRLGALGSDGDDGSPPAVSLRPRELEVLRLMSGGVSTAQIADELGLTVNTIRTYIQSLMEKLGARTRIQAVVAAQQRGLV